MYARKLSQMLFSIISLYYNVNSGIYSVNSFHFLDMSYLITSLAKCLSSALKIDFLFLKKKNIYPKDLFKAYL